MIHLGGGSGKSGKSNSFSLPTCPSGSGKSGKSGSNNQFWRDLYFGESSHSGKSGKSGGGYCKLSNENKAEQCVSDRSEDTNGGCWLQPDLTVVTNPALIDKVEKIKLDEPICGSLSTYGFGPLDQDFDVYKFDVICPGLHSVIIRSTGPNPLLIEDPHTNMLVPLIDAAIFGPDSECQALVEGVFTNFVGEVCDAEDKDTVYLDETTFAFTINIPECGSYLFDPLQVPIAGLVPACEKDNDVNCGLVGGFLYSIEVTEGTVKGNELGGTFFDDECTRRRVKRGRVRV